MNKPHYHVATITVCPEGALLDVHFGTECVYRATCTCRQSAVLAVQNTYPWADIITKRGE